MEEKMYSENKEKSPSNYEARLHEAQAPSNFIPPSTVTHRTVIIEETVVQYGPEIQSTVCPYCRLQVLTRIKSEPNTKTHLYACLLFLFICPLACVPYFIPACQNSNHYCPACGAHLGTYVN